MRVVVVGVCSVGKSTLEEGLKRLGYDAHSCVQEHSYVQDMWRTSQPDVLVYLDASPQALRRRGGTGLDDAALAEQRAMLVDARQHCQLYVNTDRLSADKVLRRVRRFLEKRA